MSTDVPTDTRPRRWLLPVGLGLAAVLLGVAVLLLGGGNGARPGSAGAAAPAPAVPTGAEPAPSAAPEPTARVSDPPTGPASEPTGLVADELPASHPPVPLDATAEVDGRIAATVESLEAIRGTAVGPGNVAGPALRVTVRLLNRSADPVLLDGVAVSLTSGEQQTPAPPLADPSAAPFSGTVGPGDSAEGVYVFTLPEDARDLVTVSVGYDAGEPYMVFTGSAR